MAAIYAHERCQLVDHEAVDAFRAKLTISSSNPNITDRAWLLAGLFAMHAGDFQTAKSHFQTLIKLETPQSVNGLIYLGWLDIVQSSSDPNEHGKPITWFEKALSKSPQLIEALYGQMQVLRRQRRKVKENLDIASKLIVYYPSFLPAYIDRMFVYLEMAAWDQVVETAQQIVVMAPDNIDALSAICLNEMCREGGAKMAPTYLDTIYQSLCKVEPKNAELFYSTARPFARLANRNPRILDLCLKFVDRAISINSTKSEYHAELAYIYFLQGQVAKARECFQGACKLDAHNVSALEGIVRCQLFSGELDQAQEQLEIFNELQNSMGRSAEIAFLNSVLSWKRQRDSFKRLKFLKEAVLLQLQVVNSRPLSLEYYVHANPGFLLEIVNDYMEHCIADGIKDSFGIQSVIRIVQDLLEVICKMVPASTEALYFLAKAKLLLGDKVAAELSLSNCLKLNDNNAKAHLLMAEIHISNNYHKPTMASLDMALSYDFEIRNRPIYHLLKARSLKLQQSYDEAISVLKTALNLPSIREILKDGKLVVNSGSSVTNDKTPTVVELASIYVEMISVYTLQKSHADVKRCMQEAQHLFLGTSEEPRILIVMADVHLDKGEVDTAISKLNTVRPDQTYFLDAKSKMADIYLKFKKDRKSYAQCYSDIVERYPTVESCLLLGDAYMNIQEPDQAVAVYQSALVANPDQSILANKIGKALIKTHDYGRAIAYYQSAVNITPNAALGLRYDLAELLLKLKRYDEAQLEVEKALDHPPAEEAGILHLDVNLYRLLARVHKGALRPDMAFSSFANARDTLHRMLSNNNAGDVAATKQNLADVCFELGEISQYNMKDYDRSISYYNEALQSTPMHKKASVALAKLFIKKNDSIAAQNQLATMLKADIAIDDASLMMAEILSQQNSFDQSFYHFRQVLDKNPTNYKALAFLINIARRNARLEDAEIYFEAAKRFSSKAEMNPGYHFCRGLFLRYMNKTYEAMKEFVVCRRDAEWGEEALYHLIELFLNPEGDVIGGEALHNSSEPTKDKESEDSDILGLLNVDKLLKVRGYFRIFESGVTYQNLALYRNFHKKTNL